QRRIKWASATSCMSPGVVNLTALVKVRNSIPASNLILSKAASRDGRPSDRSFVWDLLATAPQARTKDARTQFCSAQRTDSSKYVRRTASVMGAIAARMELPTVLRPERLISG